MRVVRKRPKGVQASFGLAIILFGLTPVRVGPQDLASLLARQPGVTERWREHLIASPFGTIHAATFSFPRPIGTAIPEAAGYRLASLGPDVTGSFATRAVFDPREPEPPQFPVIDRTRKGDRLVAQEREAEPAPSAQTSEPARREAPAVQGKYVLASASPVPDDISAAPDLHAPIAIDAPETIAPGGQPPAATEEPGAPPAQRDAAQAELDPSEQDSSPPSLGDEVSPTIRTARIYFGTEPMGGMGGTLQPWEPGQQPIFEDAAAGCACELNRRWRSPTSTPRRMPARAAKRSPARAR